MSKLSLLGSDAPALFGPVMTLASLPRVALSINGENQQLTGTSQLSKIVGDVSSRLRSGLRTFADLSVVDRIPQSTQALLRQPLEEFLNLRFLNFALPIVGEAVFEALLSCCLPCGTPCLYPPVAFSRLIRPTLPHICGSSSQVWLASWSLVCSPRSKL